MNNLTLFQGIVSIVTIYLALIIHEITHYIYFKFKGREPKLKFFVGFWACEHNGDTTVNELKINLYLAAITGFAAIIITNVLLFKNIIPELLYLVIIVTYLCGCSSDFKTITELNYFKSMGWIEDATEVRNIKLSVNGTIIDMYTKEVK